MEVITNYTERLFMSNESTISRNGESFAFAFEWDKRDVRMDHLPGMGSVWPSLIICSLYVFVVKIAGPAFMKNRQPYEIKGLIQVYNVFQVIGSFSVFLAFQKNGWFRDYSMVCEPVNRDADPSSHAYSMAVSVCYAAYLFRFIDFADTFFFVARKKYNQVSTLHVLHHFLTPLYAWVIARYYPGGNATFGAMLNFFVHTIMYSYYFVSSLGPEYQKFLWWKKYLTSFQLTIFVISFARAFINMVGMVECGFPWQMDLVSVLMFTLMFVMFAEFYIQAYVNKPKSAKKNK